jgi:hypothetical protein
MTIRPVGAELSHADRRRDRTTDGQTDMTKLIVAFRNFAKAPEKERKKKPLPRPRGTLENHVTMYGCVWSGWCDTGLLCKNTLCLRNMKEENILKC